MEPAQRFSSHWTLLKTQTSLRVRVRGQNSENGMLLPYLPQTDRSSTPDCGYTLRQLKELPRLSLLRATIENQLRLRETANLKPDIAP